jgi:hypothetical protein
MTLTLVRPSRHVGGTEVYLNIVTLSIEEVSDQLLNPPAVRPHGTHCKGDSAVLAEGIDNLEKRKACCLYRKSNYNSPSCPDNRRFTVPSCRKKSTWCTIFPKMFIGLLYMFRATMCPSSGENTVPMRHPVFATVYG